MLIILIFLHINIVFANIQIGKENNKYIKSNSTIQENILINNHISIIFLFLVAIILIFLIVHKSLHKYFKKWLQMTTGPQK